MTEQVWSFFKDGICTGVMFSGTPENLALNLGPDEKAIPGPFAPGDPEPIPTTQKD